MTGKPNTTSEGKAFKKSLIKKVWTKAEAAEGHPEDIWRKDIKGRIMNFQEFGNRKSKYGWEIDHIRPVVEGGDDNINNLQPLHWQTNEEKGDTFPWP